MLQELQYEHAEKYLVHEEKKKNMERKRKTNVHTLP